MRGKLTSKVIRSLKNVSKETLKTIDSIKLMVEQAIYHKAEFRGFSTLTEQQIRNNMNTALRVVRNIEQKGFMSIIPKAESIATELDQLRKLVSTRDLEQLREALGNSQVLIARNRHKTNEGKIHLLKQLP
jgi:hypothetical protein